jgi:serine/threonine protein kinase
MDRRWSGSPESHRYGGREQGASQTPPRHSHSPVTRHERYEHRRRHRRSRSLGSPRDNVPFRRRREYVRRQRSSSSDYNQRRPRSRGDGVYSQGYHRHVWYDSDERYNRRKARPPENRRKRKKRRPEDNEPNRRRRPASLSPSLVRPPGALPASRRAGVVSDDEPDLGVASLPLPSKHESNSSSGRDDTVGHFRGGIGTVIGDRYKVVRDVGLGTFGRVVECLDFERARKSRARQGKGDTNYVAIKIVRGVRRYYDSAIIEANIVEEVNRRGGRGISHCAILHDCFTWNSHYCLVFESLGPSLYDFLKKHNYCGFPMICVRDFTRQLLEALEFMHSFGLIHTDLKPENILLVSYREVPYKWHGRTYMIPESTKVKVIDFGGATYDNEKKSSIVNTRQYRAPEVILGLGWSTPSDLWSAGCILAELYLGDLLFPTHDNQEHLALIEKIVSPFPTQILNRAKNSKLVEETFNSSGRHRVDRVLPPERAAYVSKMLPLESMILPEDRRFLDLIRMLLVINPDDRASAQTCVRHRV